MASTFNKKLEGVVATKALFSLYEDCLSLCKKESKPLLATVSTDSSEAPLSPKSSNNTNAGDSTVVPSAALLSPLSLDEAGAVILDFERQHQEKIQKKKVKIFPIPLIRSMQVVLQNCTTNTNTSNDNNSNTGSFSTPAQLEVALGQTKVAFTPPPQTLHANKSSNDESPAKRRFRERMGRLRLQYEETKYYKLTSNIDTSRGKHEDDITAKSMSYAASVGLNMIVAPISFGVFMFFFSGPILGFLWRNYSPPSHPGAVDVRKVIIGVISGVAMLFIEMMLFVIRTHEFERGMRIKQQKKGTSVRPFGDYSSASKKTYTTGTAAATTTTTTKSTANDIVAGKKSN